MLKCLIHKVVFPNIEIEKACLPLFSSVNALLPLEELLYEGLTYARTKDNFEKASPFKRNLSITFTSIVIQI